MATFDFLGRLSDQFKGPLQISIPTDITSIAALRPWLCSQLQSDVFSEASIRAIVNQEMAAEDTVISDKDEIVFYPPVGGG